MNDSRSWSVQPAGCSLFMNVVFEVLTAVNTQMAVFWVVAPCSLVELYQRFRGPCCLHHRADKLLPDYMALSQKTAIYERRI
jgi:hypothetical protein